MIKSADESAKKAEKFQKLTDLFQSSASKEKAYELKSLTVKIVQM